MDIFLRILGFLAIGGLALAVAMMIRSLGKALPVRLGRQLVETIVSVVILIVYVAILGVTPVGWLSAVLFALGLAVGYLTSRSVDLELRDGDVVSRRSTWYLVLWAATIAITQLLALTASWGAVAFGVATVYFSTAVVVGRNGTLLVRRAGLLRREGRSWAVGDLDGLGTEIVPGAGVGEGASAARDSTGSAPPAIPAAAFKDRFCTRCGAPFADDAASCARCGEKRT